MNSVNIKLSNNIKTKESFEEFYAKLEETPNIKPNEIKEIALNLRGNYKWAIKLLKLALKRITQYSKNNDSSEFEEIEIVKYKKIVANEIMIYMAAILFNNGVKSTKILQKCEEDNSSDPRLAIIKGYQHYIERGYENALFEFSKINYTKGINLCNIMLRKKKEILETNDLFLMSFLSSNLWVKLRGQLKENQNQNQNSYYKDFIYRINSTNTSNINDTFIDSGNNSIDILLSKLKYEENEIGKLLSLRSEYKDVCYLAEINYSIGKIYHKINDLENAKVYYLLALESDGDYLPAIYNLMRINQMRIYINNKDDNTLFNYIINKNSDLYDTTVINDYNALIAIKEMNCSFNFNKFKCSNKIKKLYNLFLGCEKLEVNKIGLIENLLYDLYKEKKEHNKEKSSKVNLDVNNINLSLYGDRIDFNGVSIDLIVLLNNLGILYFLNGEKNKSQKIFEKSIELQTTNESDIQEPNDINRIEFLKYNLILSKGHTSNNETDSFKWEDLKDIDFNEAKINYLYNKNNNGKENDNLPLNLFYYLKIDSERDQAMKYFENELINSSDLFSRICLCHMHLQEHEFKKAMELCFKPVMTPKTRNSKSKSINKSGNYLVQKNDGISSFYIMNILGVIYAKKGFLKEAVQLLEQVFLDLDLNLNKTNNFKLQVCLNLGNCYFLLKEYEKCIKYYKLSVLSNKDGENNVQKSLNSGDEGYVKRILLNICYKCKYLKLVDQVIEFYKMNFIDLKDSNDLKDLNNLKLELLIKNKKFLEAREFATKENLFLEENVMNEQEVEMERKKKEIEEYRKRKRFQ